MILALGTCVMASCRFYDAVSPTESRPPGYDLPFHCSSPFWLVAGWSSAGWPAHSQVCRGGGSGVPDMRES